MGRPLGGRRRRCPRTIPGVLVASRSGLRAAGDSAAHADWNPHLWPGALRTPRGRRRRGPSPRDSTSGRPQAMTGIAGLTADEFYRQRDSRAGMVATSTAYRVASVGITLGSDATSFA